MKKNLMRKQSIVMKNNRLITAMLFLLTGGILFGQTGGKEMKLTLKDAQEYAIKNNKTVKNARLDYEESKLAIWSAISNVLPQISMSGSFNDNLKLMTTLLPGDFFGKPGTKVPVTFGSQFNIGATAQASVLLFNAPTLIGIETSKLANKMSSQSLEKSEQDIRETVSSVYYLILVSESSLEIIEKNIHDLNETLKATKAMLAAGMAEQTDVDQMTSTVTMAENSKSNLERMNEVNYNLLRLELGVTIDTQIKLSETLDDFIKTVDVNGLLAQKFDFNKNIQYRIMESQEKMFMLQVKTQKSTILPTLTGFINYGVNGMGDQTIPKSWFQNSMTGLQISVPILASGQRSVNIKRAKIILEQVRTNKDMVTDQLLLQEKQLRYNLVNADQQYKMQKENIAVSQRVYNSMENKFKQGMASSLELTQANQLYLQAENNYISALMNLLQSKLALDKLLNNF